MVISRAEIKREDIRKTYKMFYSLKDKEVNFYSIPEMSYLVTSGAAARNIYKMYDYKEIWTMGRFINRVKYYTVRDLNKNFSRMPLELDWSENGSQFTAMTCVPDYIDQEIFTITMSDLNRRFGGLDFTISLTKLPSRYCAQLLHIGSYDFIDSSRQHLENKLESMGYKTKGRIQEIYMNHPHCNPPEKLKILLRQEVDVLQQ